MNEIQEMIFAMGGEEQEELARRQLSFLGEQRNNVHTLSEKIGSQRENISILKKMLSGTYEPERNGHFLEAEGFDGFNSLRFFYELGHFLDEQLSKSLDRLPRIKERADRMSWSWNGSVDVRKRKALVEMLEDGEHAKGIFQDAIGVLQEGILPFDQVAKKVYQRAIDQFRYLQKRFLNLGGDDSRVYRDPWNEDKKGGFDLARIPYVKTELVKDNALLTDLLLDVAEQLPLQHTRKKKVKGKRKSQEVKYVDEFEVDRTSRVLVELGNDVYQGYIQDPRSFMQKIGRTIGHYHDLMSGVEAPLKSFVEGIATSPLIGAHVKTDILRKPMPNPAPIISRLTAINYNSVQPNEEDVRPSNQLERRQFVVRRALLEHLSASLDQIVRTPDYNAKLAVARSAVEQGIKLREKMREAMETVQTKKLKLDKKSDNEFYVGTSHGHGEFGFEREVAPPVRLKDVYGKSFDKMKEHLTDLADYSKYLSLFGATAPRGKIKSNIIAIGPYGCGKTEIGRAIAGDPRFIGAEVMVTDLLTCWFGEFEKNVDRVWDAAKELRKNSGDSKLVFLLMDEFDSWFNASNGHWVDNTYSRVQKAIQMKLDGVVDYEGIITVGFTNEPRKIPLSIYRRFKYVDIVGELDAGERVDLLKKFLTNGLPLSSGFREQDYQKWGQMLEGATGDVIGKVADDIHYDFMRKIIDEHPGEARKLNSYVARMQRKKDGEVDKPYVRRTMGQYLRVTPDWVDQNLQAKLAEPIIREQIDTAKRVYAEAREVMASLHTRKDAASGVVGQSCAPNSQYKQGQNIE